MAYKILIIDDDTEVDFSEGRTVLFSTHVVEDLAATCNRLAVMKNGKFLYSGNMKELLEQARGHVWICKTKEEGTAREPEKKYHVSSKQYVGDELQMKFISETQPQMECSSCEATLEDAYIYIARYKGCLCFARNNHRGT